MAVLDLTTAAFGARALHLAAELGIADHIDAAPVSVQTLAAQCEVDADALDRVLQLLAAQGLIGRPTRTSTPRHPDCCAPTIRCPCARSFACSACRCSGRPPRPWTAP
jgi:hypothetical protein